MTFYEWVDKHENIDINHPYMLDLAEAFEAGHNNGYDAGQADGYQEGTLNGNGLDDGRT